MKTEAAKGGKLNCAKKRWKKKDSRKEWMRGEPVKSKSHSLFIKSVRIEQDRKNHGQPAFIIHLESKELKASMKNLMIMSERKEDEWAETGLR